MCIAKRVSRIRDPSLPEHSWSGWLGCRWERECGRYARLFTAEQHRRSRNLYRRSMTSDPGKTRQSAPSRPLSRTSKEGDENFLRPRANVFYASFSLLRPSSFFLRSFPFLPREHSTPTFLYFSYKISNKFYFPPPPSLFLFLYIYICSFTFFSYFIAPKFFSSASISHLFGLTKTQRDTEFVIPLNPSFSPHSCGR